MQFNIPLISPVWARNLVSTMVRAMKYNTQTKELVITFNTGRDVLYAGVPEDVADQLSKAPSVGAFMNENIRYSYPYTYLS